MAAPALAQLSTASITGVVRDGSGSPVAHARLTLTNLDTSVSRAAESNDSGNYLFLSIQPGNYSLIAESAGFQKSEIPRITLAVSQTATLDLSLQVGTLQQTLTVEAAGELLQQSTAEVGAVIASKQVVDLPLNGRNFTQLLSLAPGVAPVSVSQNSGGFGNVASGTQFSFPAINGQTNRSNFFLTDGLNNQGAFQSTYAVPPIIDSIAEFKVSGHNDLAEFGGVLGGIINVATKSGTNALHGTLWEYLRNSEFNARNTFQPTVTVFRQNQFGVSAGGPVVIPKLYNGKNRTFFFGAYEGFRYSRNANAFKRYATDAELSGDLTGGPQAFDPASTIANPANPGTFVRTPFANNQIPANRIDARMANLIRQIRPNLFNTGNGNNNAIDNTPFLQNQNEYSARIDQTLGTKDSFWFRYSSIYYDTSGTGGIPVYAKTITDNPGQNFGASWVHTFSPSLVLQAQYGRSHQETNSQNVFNGISSSVVQGLGYNNNFSGNFIGNTAVVPSIALTTYSTIPGVSSSLNPNETNVHQWKANVSKIIGDHTLRFGGEINSSTFESLYASASIGYAQQQTSDPTNPSLRPGNTIASLLLNVPDNANRRNVHETTRWGGVMGFYFQDSWKASSRLTVNLGLRYDRTFIPPYGREDTIGQPGGIETGSLNLNNGTYIVQKLPPSCASRGFAPCIPGNGTLPANVVVSPNGKIYRDTTTNWAPRIGVAYRATATTAVRAGFGIYYDNWAAVTQLAQNYEGSWPDVGQQIANNLNLPTSTQATPSVTGQNPFAVAGAFPAPTPFNQVQWFYDPYNKNPYSMQWNFGVAKQLNSTTTVNVDYVGSGSRRLNLGGYYNVAQTPGAGDPAQRRLFPYITPTYYDRSIGRGNYNSLQLQFNRRFSRGFAYQFSYTYSKTIDIGSSGWFGVEGQSVQDPYHFNNDRSVSGFDLTHTFSSSILYEIPVGKGKLLSTGNRVADYILGGWQLNTITSARSGQPFNLSVSGDTANTGNTSYLRPNFAGGDAYLANPTRQLYFNTSLFSAPAAYTFGNFGRYGLRSSPFWNIDVSIFRQFPFAEGRSVEFRAESFNMPNTTILGSPTGSFTDPNFGKVTSTANTERSLQFGLKVIF